MVQLGLILKFRVIHCKVNCDFYVKYKNINKRLIRFLSKTLHHIIENWFQIHFSYNVGIFIICFSGGNLNATIKNKDTNTCLNHTPKEN